MTRVIKSGVSVDWQGEAWYRVMGDAGTRIPEDPFTSTQSGYGKYCKTFCPGYLPSGSHPQTPGELIHNVTVRHNCAGSISNISGRHRHDGGDIIKIRNCGDYFVYFLSPHSPRGYVSRYCTE